MAVPIEDHGIIGDCATAALVTCDGTIDFLCWPRFDSPTVFASVLDESGGGSFSLRPELEGARHIQTYLPDSNVLITRWLSAAGSAEAMDAMVPALGEDGGLPRLIRRVRATRGTVRISLRCAPRFDYGRETPHLRPVDRGVMFETATMRLRLTASAKLDIAEGAAVASVELEAGETLDLVLDAAEALPLAASEVTEAFEHTIGFWRAWSRKSSYRGRWREVVGRSALLLKLLTARDHGSIVAAPTFGLPEEIGGSRNWDYRAVWVRDASFTVYAFLRLGYAEEAAHFMGWMSERASASEDGRIRIMYALDGSDEASEVELEHLAGYADSKPVLIGNEAFGQVQLDIYGELLDSIYLSNKYGNAISHDGWCNVRRIIEHVCERWQVPDAGIWEMRDTPREFLHSRMMCWVALDRALRLARKRSLAAPFQRWERIRNEIHDDIWANFWNEERGYFVQAKGSTDVDAALLLMPLVRFVSATDPRWLATLDAIRDQLTDDGMVYRYVGPDGLHGHEGAFTACSFWYVECPRRTPRRGARGVRKGPVAREPPRPVQRAARRVGRASRQLPPGADAPRADQRRLLPRPRARGRVGHHLAPLIGHFRVRRRGLETCRSEATSSKGQRGAGR